MTWLWKIGGGLAVLVAAYFLVTMYGKARYSQGIADSDVAWSMKVIQAEKDKLKAYQDGIASVQAAIITYHETVEKLVPVTKTIIERARDYAQTDEGALVCLPIERVHGIDETRSTLFPTATPTGTDSGVNGVSPDPARGSTGRINVPRGR